MCGAWHCEGNGDFLQVVPFKNPLTVQDGALSNSLSKIDS